MYIQLLKKKWLHFRFLNNLQIIQFLVKKTHFLYDMHFFKAIKKKKKEIFII